VLLDIFLHGAASDDQVHHILQGLYRGILQIAGRPISWPR
jgi:hypothetical protein